MGAIGFTQAGRALRIDTALGPEVLLLRSIAGQEAISQLFRFQLELMSETDDISFDSVVGTKATVHIQTNGGERILSGFISRFSQGGRDKRFTYYRAEMVPWLWFLTRQADCRIFQNQTVPAILQKLFTDAKGDFELRLYKTYSPRIYCVQYRETTFNFVSRLMEEEGIHYFFNHDAEQNKHTLILADDDASHQPCAGQPAARCDQDSKTYRAEDLITEFRLEQEYRTTAWTHTDYNFETPSTNLMAKVKEGSDEVYDYPGEYSKKADGDKLARIRLEETLSVKMRGTGKSNCRCFQCGTLVELQDHYRDDVNQKWLMTAVYHHCTIGEAYGSGGTDEEHFYRNTFECIPATVSLRPLRLTPKPAVQGPQTAVVVGPANEEIYTDKYGRVKVQFFWDRLGQKNENSSCWVRVSSPWAGKQWGGIYIPRIGQEVIVDFLEGDPDYPIITGRVYNAEQMPPWGLPTKKVISGVKSNSTKGGGGYNEISMDDTKGTELINVHAQYDQAIRVNHDERTSIGVDRTENVGNNETITIGVNRTETVGANESITIGANRVETVGQNETISVAMMRTRNVGINEMINIGAAQEVTIGGLQTVTVGVTRAVTVGTSQHTTIGTNLTEDIGSNHKISVGANLTENVSSDQTTSVGGNRSSKVGSNDTLDVGSNLNITAGTEIVIGTGASKLTMKSDGTIELSGMNITINGSTAFKAEAVQINIEASGINTIKGSLVKIN